MWIRIARRASARGNHGGPLLVVADIIRLPFTDSLFASATTAETLEHIPDDARAVQELARVLRPGGTLAGTVPAGPSQWSDWDEWAGHLRRYTRDQVTDLLSRAGFESQVTVWGWPLLRLYDDLFLKRINRRRLHHAGKLEDEPTLGRVSGLGKRRGLGALVRSVFGIDRLFDGMPWGVGLLFVGRKGKKAEDGLRVKR
ncbi:MAG: class I SAM-dependent methyltransferase [Acidobacteriota bacterium]